MDEIDRRIRPEETSNGLQFKTDDGWTYRYVNGEIGIEYPEGKKEPDVLYKYYNCSHNSLDALQKSYLFASRLGFYKDQALLNDPFDCTQYVLATDPKLSISDLENRMCEINHFYKKEMDKFDGKGEIYHTALRNIALALYNTSIWRNFGIIAMTADWKNPCMWAHYTQNNQGFAVGFYTENLKSIQKLKGPFFMHYKDNPESLIVDFKQENYPLSLLYVQNIKLTSWEYEQEWRFVAGEKGMDIDEQSGHELGIKNGDYNKRRISYQEFQGKIIKEIILGYYFDPAFRNDKVGKITTKKGDGTQDEDKVSLLNYIVKNQIDTYMLYPTSQYNFDKPQINIWKEDDLFKYERVSIPRIECRTEDFQNLEINEHF